MRNEIVVFWDDGELSIYADVHALRQHVEPWMPEAGAVKGAWRLDGSRIDLVLTAEQMLDVPTSSMCDRAGLSEAIRAARESGIADEESFDSLVAHAMASVGVTEYQDATPVWLVLRRWIRRLVLRR
jgi:hypothetical protein